MVEASLSGPTRRRRALVLLGAAGALLFGGTLALSAMPVSMSAAPAPDVVVPDEGVVGADFPPTVADGLVDDGMPLTISNTSAPAIARLDPDLRRALTEAQAMAADDGIRFQITSGWRSEAYQRWLMTEAIATLGSEEAAREIVAEADASSHVTGRAVDIGNLDAQEWLEAYGQGWGLCRTYANESWHFERATSPGGDCPTMKTDARG